MNSSLRIAVLDDHLTVREGIESILRDAPDLIFVGGAGDEHELWPLLHRVQPDILLLDLHHPGRDGLALSTLISGVIRAPRIILHTAVSSDELSVAATLAGATASVGKDSTRLALLDTIRSAGRADAEHEQLRVAARGRVMAPLDDTERAIVAMRLDGTPVAGVAEALRLRPVTVDRRIAGVVRLLSRSAHRPPLTA